MKEARALVLAGIALLAGCAAHLPANRQVCACDEFELQACVITGCWPEGDKYP